VNNLKLYNKKSGYYLMISDEYSQLYIGITDDIKLRIQQHWVRKGIFDIWLYQ